MIIKVNFRWRVCHRQYLSQDHILEIYYVSALNRSYTTIIDVNQSVFRKIGLFHGKISSLISKKPFFFQTRSVDFSGDSPMKATITSIFKLSSLLEASFDKNMDAFLFWVSTCDFAKTV